MFNSNPLAEANGNKEKKKKLILLSEANDDKEMKKPEINVVVENIYCRRFQPTDQMQHTTDRL